MITDCKQAAGMNLLFRKQSWRKRTINGLSGMGYSGTNAHFAMSTVSWAVASQHS